MNFKKVLEKGFYGPQVDYMKPCGLTIRKIRSTHSQLKKPRVQVDWSAKGDVEWALSTCWGTGWMACSPVDKLINTVHIQLICLTKKKIQKHWTDNMDVSTNDKAER